MGIKKYDMKMEVEQERRYWETQPRWKKHLYYGGEALFLGFVGMMLLVSVGMIFLAIYHGIVWLWGAMQ